MLSSANDSIRDRAARNAIERNDGDPALQLALLQQQLARLLRVHHNVVKAASGSHLKCSRSRSILDGNKLSDESVYLDRYARGKGDGKC